MKQICSLVTAALACLVLAGSAGAEGFSIIDWSARGVGLAGGMVGRADDASAVAYNPAGITQLPGAQMMLGTTVVSPMGKVDTYDARGLRTTTKVERKHWNMPHMYFTYQFSERLWGGVGVFSRFGLGNGYDGTWPMSSTLSNVSLQTVTLNPNIAIKVTDKLSIAAGVEFSGAMMEMNRHYRMGALLGNNHAKLTGQGGAISANLALRYAFNDAWAVGLTYRSRMAMNVHGKLRWDRQVYVPRAQISMLDSDLHGTISLPDSIAAAVVWKPTSRLSLEAGVVYTAWSNYKHLDIYLEYPNQVQYGPKHWRDTWAFNGSVEFQALDWLTLRAGYGYETSPANKANADYMAPTNGRQYFTGGIGLAWNDWTMDIGYSYIDMKDLSFDDAARTHPKAVAPGKTHHAYANVVSLTFGYKF